MPNSTIPPKPNPFMHMYNIECISPSAALPRFQTGIHTSYSCTASNQAYVEADHCTNRQAIVTLFTPFFFFFWPSFVLVALWLVSTPNSVSIVPCPTPCSRRQFYPAPRPRTRPSRSLNGRKRGRSVHGAARKFGTCQKR